MATGGPAVAGQRVRLDDARRCVLARRLLRDLEERAAIERRQVSEGSRRPKRASGCPTTLGRIHLHPPRSRMDTVDGDLKENVLFKEVTVDGSCSIEITRRSGAAIRFNHESGKVRPPDVHIAERASRVAVQRSLRGDASCLLQHQPHHLRLILVVGAVVEPPAHYSCRNGLEPPRSCQFMERLSMPHGYALIFRSRVSRSCCSGAASASAS